MQTKLEEVLKHKGRVVHRIVPDSTVRDAVRLMNRQRIGAVIIEDNGSVVGIFTERDVLVRVVAADVDARTTLVKDVMTTHPVTVGLDMRVGEAMRVITERRARHLPVVDSSGHLVGLVSIGDLTSWVTQSLQVETQSLQEEVAQLERTVNDLAVA